MDNKADYATQTDVERGSWCEVMMGPGTNVIYNNGTWITTQVTLLFWDATPQAALYRLLHPFGKVTSVRPSRPPYGPAGDRYDLGDTYGRSPVADAIDDWRRLQLILGRRKP